jgi:acetyltransferase-like isoleucine patch superfamily enzyme
MIRKFNFRTIVKKLIKYIFYIYYLIKIKIITLILGNEAISFVLYDSYFPLLVLKIGGAKIGKNVRINRWLTIHESKGNFVNLIIGDDVFVGKHVLIDLSERIVIKDRCAIGMNVCIITHRNFGDSLLKREYPSEVNCVIVNEDTIINWGVIINKGTIIGPKVIVLPGTVVSGRLKEKTTYVGNPMRVLPRI